ncbi:MAG: hypothetical protein QG645_228, partial [Patescibacteria group bacterium]|nr:hypothetical protein [Patescibacteria group bacterium]
MWWNGRQSKPREWLRAAILCEVRHASGLSETNLHLKACFQGKSSGVAERDQVLYNKALNLTIYVMRMWWNGRHAALRWLWEQSC